MFPQHVPQGSLWAFWVFGFLSSGLVLAQVFPHEDSMARESWNQPPGTQNVAIFHNHWVNESNVFGV